VSTSERYPIEPTCDSDWKCENPDHPKDEHGYCGHPTDDGTMPENVSDLAEKVVGHRIVSVSKRQVSERHRYGLSNEALVIQLDSGVEVQIVDTDDCCAHTSLESFLLHPDKVDHIITGVGTTDGYEKWHIYADMGDVLELQVGWSCGNPFYYGYGFDIAVAPIGADQ
jgi:hypothetical protein